MKKTYRKNFIIGFLLIIWAFQFANLQSTNDFGLLLGFAILIAGMVVIWKGIKARREYKAMASHGTTIRGATDAQNEIIEETASISNGGSNIPSVNVHDSRQASLEDCIIFSIKKRQVSIADLQRELKVGYTTAGKYMEEMAKRGIVENSYGTRIKPVLVSFEEWQEMKATDQVKTNNFTFNLLLDNDPILQRHLKDLKLSIAANGLHADIQLTSEDQGLLNVFLDDFLLGNPSYEDNTWLQRNWGSINQDDPVVNVQIQGGALDIHNNPRPFIAVITVKLKQPLIHPKYTGDQLPVVKTCFRVKGDCICFISSTGKIHLPLSSSCGVNLTTFTPMILQEAVDAGYTPCSKCF